MCALMFGYFALLNRSRFVADGRLQPLGLDAGGGEAAEGGGDADPLPLEHGQGRLSQYWPSLSESRVSAAAWASAWVA